MKTHSTTSEQGANKKKPSVLITSSS